MAKENRTKLVWVVGYCRIARNDNHSKTHIQYLLMSQSLTVWCDVKCCLAVRNTKCCLAPCGTVGIAARNVSAQCACAMEVPADGGTVRSAVTVRCSADRSQGPGCRGDCSAFAGRSAAGKCVVLC
jgi:hypothetical protein